MAMWQVYIHSVLQMLKAISMGLDQTLRHCTDAQVGLDPYLYTHYVGFPHDMAQLCFLQKEYNINPTATCRELKNLFNNKL